MYVGAIAAAAGEGQEGVAQPSVPRPVAPSAQPAPSPAVTSSKKRKAAPSATPSAAAGSRPAEAEGSAPPPQSSQQCGRPGPLLPWPQPRLPSLSHLLMSDWVALHVSHPTLRAEELLPLAAGGKGCRCEAGGEVGTALRAEELLSLAATHTISAPPPPPCCTTPS